MISREDLKNPFTFPDFYPNVGFFTELKTTKEDSSPKTLPKYEMKRIMIHQINKHNNETIARLTVLSYSYVHVARRAIFHCLGEISIAIYWGFAPFTSLILN